MGQEDRQLQTGVRVGFNQGQAFLGKCLSVQMVFDQPLDVEANALVIQDTRDLEKVFVDADDRLDSERLPA